MKIGVVQPEKKNFDLLLVTIISDSSVYYSLILYTNLLSRVSSVSAAATIFLVLLCHISNRKH